MGVQRSCGDVLLVPMGIQGHVNPNMHVVKYLLKRGITVTMVLSEDDRAIMGDHIEDTKIEGPNANFRLELMMSVKKLAKREPGFLGMCNDFGRVCEPFLKQVLAEQEAGGEGPKCMIADQFMGWTQSWATKLQIPRYVSIVSPATFGYYMFNHSILMKRDNLLEKLDENPILNLPGSPTLRLDDISMSATVEARVIPSSGDTFGQAAGMLFNTFYDLEASVIDAFDAQVRGTSGGKGPKMLPIGPMLPPEFFSKDPFVGTAAGAAAAADFECIRWLNSRPSSSVIYVAFGSAGFLSRAQIQELAGALEASKLSFLWILRAQSSGGLNSGRGPRAGAGAAMVDADVPEEMLPAGFQARTQGRGFVQTRFAPQLHILAHPATGGFLTHCGWNSALESICRGVPMIGWPLAAEQKICCRVLEDAGVAAPIRPKLTDAEDLVESEEVEKALRVLMVEDEGKRLRARALELQHKARLAVESGGSSTRSLNKLVLEIQSRSSRISQES